MKICDDDEAMGIGARRCTGSSKDDTRPGKLPAHRKSGGF